MSLNFLRRRKTILSGLALAALAVVAFTIPASAVGPGHLTPANTGSYVDSVSGGAVLGATNQGSGDPFNDYGVEGIVSNDVGGVGVLGYGSQAKSYGAYGVTFGTNGIGVYGAGDGPTPAPGNTPSSTQQSTGVVGNSASGEGVFGSTEFPNASGDVFGGSPVAGVEGIDVTTNGEDNNGVVGITTNGGFGVVGFSADASNGSGDVVALGGVEGTATKGNGVSGFSNSGFGVSGESDTNYAVYGGSDSGDGVHGVTNSASASGVAGINTTGSGVYGSSNTSTGGNFFSGSGYGVTGQTDSTTAGAYGSNTGSGYGVWGSGKGTGPGVYALNVSTGEGLLVRNETTSAYAADVANEVSGGDGLESEADYIGLIGRSNTYPLVLTNESSANEFYVTSAGDVYYAGSLNSFARTRNGYTASTFTARMATPTVEDVGTGSIVNGSGIVRLDPALVEQMDRSTAYKVFLQPDGDTRGLFVATKTAEGFVVRETQGGRNSLSFDYRIVASVDGQATRRMSLSRASDSQGPRAPSMGVRGIPGLSLMPQDARLTSFSAKAPRFTSKQLALQKLQKAAVSAHRMFVPQPNLAVEAMHRHY